MSEAVEFFDTLLKADEMRQIGLALRQAERDLKASKTKTCGRCYWWMKSNDCPQERNVRGRNRGPSSSDTRATYCQKFHRSTRAEELTASLEEKVAKIANAKCFSDLPPNSHY